MSALFWIATTMLVICGIANPSFSQTSTGPIASFNDVAGKWTGHADKHSVMLEINASGRFTAKYALGGESGEARLEGGALVIPLPQHEGMLQLMKDGESLKGLGVVDGKTWTVSLERSGARGSRD
jgi:hypothetical protein